MNELMTYNYIITLLEAAKRAAKKLKKRRKRKLMEAFYGKRVMENETKFNPVKYINEVVRNIANFLGSGNYDKVKEQLKELIGKKNEVLKREHIYRLAPVINAMRDLLEKCKGDKPPINDCNDIKQQFEEFLEAYKTMKEGTPFYKRWYYWFMTLPLWKKVLVVIGLIVMFYVLLLIITKATSKAFNIVKMALSGDKEAVKNANDLVKRADIKPKLQAFKASFGVMPKNALIV